MRFSLTIRASYHDRPVLNSLFASPPSDFFLFSFWD